MLITNVTDLQKSHRAALKSSALSSFHCNDNWSQSSRIVYELEHYLAKVLREYSSKHEIRWLFLPSFEQKCVGTYELGTQHEW